MACASSGAGFTTKSCAASKLGASGEAGLDRMLSATREP